MRISFKKILFLILVVILLFFFHYIDLQSFFRAPFISTQRNFFNSTLKIKNFLKIFTPEEQLVKENEELKKKNQELLLENKDLKIIQKESEILTEQLDFLKKKKYNYVLSYLIGKTSDNPLIAGNFILDKGANDGVEIGCPVIVDQGFLVGKIVKVDKNISYLNIILDNQSMVAAVTENGVEGIVEGEHQLSLKMDFILPDKTINENDVVITSGVESLMPKGLIIGEVREVKFEAGDFFKKAILNPLIDFDNLQIVSILIPYENK